MATDEYISQVSDLQFKIQDLIQNKWIEVAKHENPKEIGSTDSCNIRAEYVVVVFPGLAYEFVYQINETEKTIRLINCERLSFLDYGQTE